MKPASLYLLIGTEQSSAPQTVEGEDVSKLISNTRRLAEEVREPTTSLTEEEKARVKIEVDEYFSELDHHASKYWMSGNTNAALTKYKDARMGVSYEALVWLASKDSRAKNEGPFIADCYHRLMNATLEYTYTYLCESAATESGIFPVDYYCPYKVQKKNFAKAFSDLQMALKKQKELWICGWRDSELCD